MQEGRDPKFAVRSSENLELRTSNYPRLARPARLARRSCGSVLLLCRNSFSAACRSLRHLVYVEGCVRLRDHSLPQATSHRAWLILFGSTGIQLPWSTYPLAGIPVPIPRENSVNASNRRRFPAQSNCLWVFVDKNRLGPNPRGPIPAFPCICLKSINCHIVTRFPSRRMVSGSTYTVCSPGKR